MAEIIKGGAGPRVMNGVLYFREGDTFAYTLHLTVKSMGQPVAPEEISRIMVMFRNDEGQVVHFFDLEADGNGTVTLEFTESVSEKFMKGRYNYDIAAQIGWQKNTLADKLSCVVV